MSAGRHFSASVWQGVEGIVAWRMGSLLRVFFHSMCDNLTSIILPISVCEKNTWLVYYMTAPHVELEYTSESITHKNLGGFDLLK